MAKTQSSFLLLPLIATISFFFFFLPRAPSSAAAPVDALVVPITKDPKTSLYTIPLKQSSSFVLDLTGPLLWSPCPTTHATVPCSSAACRAAQSSPSRCRRGTIVDPGQQRRRCICTADMANPVTGACAVGDLTLTNITLSSTDGHNPTGDITVANVVSSCSPTRLLASLPSKAAGVAGLGRSDLALGSQLSSKLSFKKQFALCLPSSLGSSPGIAFFGSGPFYVLPPPGVDITALLRYTPLLKNAKDSGYYLNVAGIAVNQNGVKFPPHALELRGGGVTISTAVSYTTLSSQIYQPFLKAFGGATSGIPRRPKVKPFDLCFNSTALGSTRLGYGVPQIDVMLGGGKNWTIFGANSIVDVGRTTACLAFVDGGPKAEHAVVIGGFQMENSLFMFDVTGSRLGYTSTLFGIRTTCSNFNFTRAG